ncbi:MAG TPA: RNase adapter RapZ, partial [Pyrinomonadaceae bacterium]|nr:RNase adapter RapZ [Pyrinomonadaceae bacterium]
ADTEPALTPVTGGVRLYFRSDRGGGSALYTVDVTQSVVDDLAPLLTGPAADTNPAVLPGDTPWLLFRSDRNVALGRLGGGVPGEVDADASRRAPEEAAIRRFAGSITAVPGDLDRNRGRRRFGDLLDYLLPLYRREGKSYVTVGVGCTGGRHRSVMVANALARRLRRAGFDASATHRDIRKTKNSRQKAVGGRQSGKKKPKTAKAKGDGR